MTDETLSLLADSAATFADRLRVSRDRAEGPIGGDHGTWREIADQSWLRILIPEAQGGLGLGLAHAVVVARELGRKALIAPYAAGLTAIACLGQIEPASGSDLLEALMAGGLRASPAWPAMGESASVAALWDGDCYRLSGEAVFAPAADADIFLVLAELAGKTALFQVDRMDPGLVVESQACADGTRVARLCFGGAFLGADRLLGRDEVLDEAMARAYQVGLNVASAELLGLMDGALAMTLDYLRARVQFGAPIGSFQALQHRAVDMWIQRQITEAAVKGAVARFDDLGSDPAERARGAVGAKARASQAALTLMSQALQLHGAIGFAEEYGLGDYLNRALVISSWIGNGAEMRRLYGRMSQLAGGAEGA